MIGSNNSNSKGTIAITTIIRTPLFISSAARTLNKRTKSANCCSVILGRRYRNSKISYMVIQPQQSKRITTTSTIIKKRPEYGSIPSSSSSSYQSTNSTNSSSSEKQQAQQQITETEMTLQSPPPPPSSSQSTNPNPNPSPLPPPLPTKRLIIAGILLVTLLLSGTVAVTTGLLTPSTFLDLAQYFEQLGPSAIYLYSLIYFALELIAVPALPLTLFSGYLFGISLGTIAVSISSSAAAAASFLIARYFLRDAFSSLASSKFPKFKAMDRAIGKQGFKVVFLLRLSPLLPFSISNYLYGLTSVDFVRYAIASWAGMLPGTLAYVSAGAAVSALADIGKPGTTQVNPIIVGIGLVATVLAVGVVGKVASNAVTEVNSPGEDTTVVDVENGTGTGSRRDD